MKFTFLIIMIVFILAITSSCVSPEAKDTELCFTEVQKIFPTSSIYVSKDEKYTFIVIDSISIKLVKTLNFETPKVTNIVIFSKK